MRVVVLHSEGELNREMESLRYFKQKSAFKSVQAFPLRRSFTAHKWHQTVSHSPALWASCRKPGVHYECWRSHSCLLIHSHFSISGLDWSRCLLLTTKIVPQIWLQRHQTRTRVVYVGHKTIPVLFVKNCILNISIVDTIKMFIKKKNACNLNRIQLPWIGVAFSANLILGINLTKYQMKTKRFW